MICFLFFISCNWFGPHPITFLTNAIAKGCGFLLHRVGVFLLHNKIPSIHFGAQRSNKTASKRYYVCNEKHEKHVKFSLKKEQKVSSIASAIEFPEHFHCSCVGQKIFHTFSAAGAENFVTQRKVHYWFFSSLCLNFLHVSS